MSTQTMVPVVPCTSLSVLDESVIDYATRVHDLRSPSDVLNGCTTSRQTCRYLSLGRQVPQSPQIGIPLKLGTCAFLHKGRPEGLVGKMTRLRGKVQSAAVSG
jgi:hypothetical protein